MEAGVAPDWLLRAAAPRKLGVDRAVSHGSLFAVILAAMVFLGPSAWNMAASSPARLNNEGAAPFYDEEYGMRRPLQVVSFDSERAAGVELPRQAVDGPYQGEGEAQAGMDVSPAVASRGVPLGPGYGGMVAIQTPAFPVTEDRGLVEYVVSQGDVVSTIAERFDVSTETVLWANNLGITDLIRVGQSLLIPPADGVVHTVEAGESLQSLAFRHRVSTEDIAGYRGNNIADPSSLALGRRLFIPGGKMPATREVGSTRGGTRPAAGPSPATAFSSAASASGRLMWPNTGLVTQYFSAGHDGLDIASPYGTPVVAADDGVVLERVALDWGYGLMVTIDHGNGYATAYAHLSSFAVGVGDRVEKGQMIARVGCTGWCTGPHDHFIVRRNGVPINPLSVLP